MKKIFLFLVALTLILACHTLPSNNQNKKEILAVLHQQEKDWSAHNLEAYMQGYWKSDSLKFYGSNGLTYGWDKTLANYKKGYPTPEHSGTLKFTVNDISKIADEAYYVMGEYHLTRKVGNAQGLFMILFKKIKGQWRIVADTSC